MSECLSEYEYKCKILTFSSDCCSYIKIIIQAHGTCRVDAALEHMQLCVDLRLVVLQQAATTQPYIPYPWCACCIVPQ